MFGCIHNYKKPPKASTNINLGFCPVINLPRQGVVYYAHHDDAVGGPTTSDARTESPKMFVRRSFDVRGTIKRKHIGKCIVAA